MFIETYCIDCLDLMEHYLACSFLLREKTSKNTLLRSMLEVIDSVRMSSEVHGLVEVSEHCFILSQQLQEIRSQSRLLSEYEIETLNKKGGEIKKLISNICRD